VVGFVSLPEHKDGGGDTKLGSVVGTNAKGGKLLKSELLKNTPALSKLLNKCKTFGERNGYLPTIDGRKIWLRSWEGKLLIHTALNCLLQSNGSILCKRAIVICNNEIKRKGLDAKQVIFYHDENVLDCEESIAEEVAEIAERSFREAGEYYKLRIRTDGESHIGKTWGDIH
jgi:DNA polymerase I-like protein with 3'-5' exonuclease and polymerase domains